MAPWTVAVTVLLAVVPVALSVSELRGSQLLVNRFAEPPAQFHTRCVTFLNSVLHQAGEKPDKVGSVLLAHCGEVKSGLATAPLATEKREKCEELGKRLVGQLKE